MGKYKFLVIALLLVVMLLMFSSVRQNTGEPLTVAERAAAVKAQIYSYLEQNDEEVQIDGIAYKWITNIENTPERIADVEKASEILGVPYRLLPGAKTMSGEPIPEDIRLFVRKDAWCEFLTTLVEVVKSRNHQPATQPPLSSQI